jgi:hypothetical protein
VHNSARHDPRARRSARCSRRESTIVVGWPGGIAPPAPTDPGVTLSRHRALLALASGWLIPGPGFPAPVGQQPRHLGGDPVPGALHGLVGPEPPVFGPDPFLDVVVDPGEQRVQLGMAEPAVVRHPTADDRADPASELFPGEPVSRCRRQSLTISLIRLIAFGLTASSNPVNLPFFPIVSRGRKAYPRKSKDTGPPHGWRRAESLQ